MKNNRDTITLSELETLIKEAVSKTDDLSVVPAKYLIQDIIVLNLASFADSIDYIKNLVFGINKETERLQNFIIKIDTILEINGFYKTFNYDLKDNISKSIFSIKSDETKFIIKYLRLFYAIRFFPESFIQNLTRDNEDE